MFRFGKPSRDSATEAGEDLLAHSEQEEFESSVRAARERVTGRIGAAEAEEKPSAAGDADTEIVWSEQPDVYRPRRIDAREYLRSQALEPAVQLCAGQSIVLIRKAVYTLAVDHLRTDLQSELGGLLGGEALYDAGLDLFVVVVEVALPALNGESTPTSFSYTPEAWEAMLPGWLRMNSDWTIVGSYHSHPGMGVFLSAVDRSTQADVFPHDWQVAMVMDPVANVCGLFVGAAGKPCTFTLIQPQ